MDSNSEKKENYVIRRLFADTFAMVIFSTVVGMIIEVFVSGITLNQSVQARLTAIPVNLIIARPYGIFRDWIIKITHANEGGQIKKAIVDIISFVIFQVPIYSTILLTTGASVHKIVIAAGMLTIVSAFVGRPYGIFLDFSRWLFRVK